MPRARLPRGRVLRRPRGLRPAGPLLPPGPPLPLLQPQPPGPPLPLVPRALSVAAAPRLLGRARAPRVGDGRGFRCAGQPARRRRAAPRPSRPPLGRGALPPRPDRPAPRVRPPGERFPPGVPGGEGARHSPTAQLVDRRLPPRLHRLADEPHTDDVPAARGPRSGPHARVRDTLLPPRRAGARAVCVSLVPRVGIGGALLRDPPATEGGVAVLPGDLSGEVSVARPAGGGRDAKVRHRPPGPGVGRGGVPEAQRGSRTVGSKTDPEARREAYPPQGSARIKALG